MNTLKLPLIRGYTCGPYLIIVDCSICGAAHTHGNPKPGYKPGDRTTRVPHCLDDRGIADICIEIVGGMTEKERTAAMRRLDRPSKKRVKPLEYIDFPLSGVGAR